MMIYRRRIETEWGKFMIEASDKGLTRVIFPDAALSFSETDESSALLEAAIVQLKNYCAGDRYDFRNLRYDFSEVSGFQEKILVTLLKLPVQTVAYSKLAQLAGSPRASRAVGNAMNQNPFPILIPCHRVIRADGGLGQYAWGQAWKTRLLKHENIFPEHSSEALSTAVFSDIIAAV